MAVGEKQALDPQPTIADNRQRVARSQRVKSAAAAPEPGTSSGRHHERLWTMGGWMVRTDRARWWEARDGVEGESARTPRMTVCTVYCTYIHA